MSDTTVGRITDLGPSSSGGKHGDMTEARAREIIDAAFDGEDVDWEKELFDGEFFGWHDSWLFTADELRAIAFWMDNKGASDE